MFRPKYTITDKLLAQIKRINILITELNNKSFSKIVLIDFEKTAKAVSSYASTSIEGNPLLLTEVKKILKSTPVNIRDSEKEVLNYNQVLENLDNELKKFDFRLSLKLILTIQGQVTKGLLSKQESGKLRQHPVVVNDPKSGKVVFLPPDIEEVQTLLKDLADFVQNKQNIIDPLIIAGIFHKQMVIIHPFMDGNGRTARLATKVLLAKMGLNTFNLFSFENYYNKNVTKYFNLVGEYGNYYDLVKNIDFTVWLEYFTEGIIDELLRVKGLLIKSSISPETQLNSYHKKIVNYINKYGFIADRDYVKLTGRAKATRALDFQKLIELGLIVRKGKGRATYYSMKV